MELKLRATDLAWHEVEGEVIVLDLRSSRYLRINKSGVVLWRALVGGAVQQTLVDCLVGDFDVDAGVAAADVQAFVDNLRARDLLA